MKSGSTEEELTFVKLHKIQSQVADKNAYTDFQCNLSLKLLQINVEALNFVSLDDGLMPLALIIVLNIVHFIGEAGIYKCKKQAQEFSHNCTEF